MKYLELLAPAGSPEALRAAVQGGADAVYLGCGDLNARRGAKNFTPQELPAAVQYCHLRGVRLYLTLNTLPSDRELDSARDMLLLSSRCGVDGVIVQDWGLAALARRVVPDLPLHGSTQMTVHSLAGVEAARRLAERLGVSPDLVRPQTVAESGIALEHAPRCASLGTRGIRGLTSYRLLQDDAETA